jgi:hypothetical protein
MINNAPIMSAVIIDNPGTNILRPKDFTIDIKP